MNENLATELLHELKESAKRWFIAFCIMVILELLTIGGFMWYISLPVEEGNITQESNNDSENTIVGGDYSGIPADSELQEKGN